MDLRELEELREKVLVCLAELDRESGLAEIARREDSAFRLLQGAEGRCSCGLVMSKQSLYEHQSQTGHRERQFRERIEICSCGLTMSSSNMREHQSESRHGSIRRPVKQERKLRHIPRTGLAGRGPRTNFQFGKSDNPE